MQHLQRKQQGIGCTEWIECCGPQIILSKGSTGQARLLITGLKK
jgi:hypothetical protein